MSELNNNLNLADKSVLTADDLDAQRAALQHELAQQRQQLLQQWHPVDDQGEPINQGHFPRSATMRFLCGRKATGVVSKLVVWQIGRRFAKYAFWKK